VHPFIRRAAAPLFLSAWAAACASAPPGPHVDLAPARAAVDEARKGGAEQRAPQALARAEQTLDKAETLAASEDRARRTEALRLAEVAATEARCALELSRSSRSVERVTIAAEGERNAGRVRRLEEEHRRLEDRIALLLRDLEMTETELIRSKARLKGNETKAEASAAIAEARILMRRLDDESGGASALARGQESLAKAEEQLLAGNYGAAIFFAMKAQDTATRSQQPAR
jgi:hypothetical protein